MIYIKKQGACSHRRNLGNFYGVTNQKKTKKDDTPGWFMGVTWQFVWQGARSFQFWSERNTLYCLSGEQ